MNTTPKANEADDDKESGHVHGPHCNHDPFHPHHHHGDKPYVRIDAKVGRNDPCPCGSGHKFKKCCALLKTKI